MEDVSLTELRLSVKIPWNLLFIYLESLMWWMKLHFSTCLVLLLCVRYFTPEKSRIEKYDLYSSVVRVPHLSHTTVEEGNRNMIGKYFMIGFLVVLAAYVVTESKR